MARLWITQLLLQAATLITVLFQSSRSQPCSTIVQLESLSSGLARATSNQNQLPIEDDVSAIIGREWNVSEEGCVQIQFSPGIYRTAPRGINITYNVALWSDDSDAIIACTNASNGSPHLFGFSKDQGSVMIQGLTFVNCSESLMFENLNSLEIINSTFSNFLAPPLDLFNCWHVDINSSTFINSYVAKANDQFRGDSGGISVAYKSANQNSTMAQPYLRVSNCTIKNNTAYYFFYETPLYRPANNYSYPGRGGGMAIVLNEWYYNITVVIDNCKFIDNNANYSGGGLYVNMAGKDTYHIITVSNSLFDGNSAQVGGGTHVVFYNGYTVSQFVTAGCTYRNNKADYGGAIATFRLYEVSLKGNRFNVTDTVFEANSAKKAGSAVAFFAYQYPFNPVKPLAYLVRNCTYVDNRSPEGILLTSFVDLDLEGTVYFGNNTGAALMNVGSLITVRGSIQFISNDASSVVGGALYILGFGQMRMIRGSKMEFNDNVGRIGAAIVVIVQDASPMYTSLQYNPQCFLVFEDPYYSPLLDHNVTIRFKGNRAVVGSAIYISSLDSCSWINSTHQSESFDLMMFQNWSAFKFIDNINTAYKNSSREYDIQTEPVQLYTKSPNISLEVEAYPGQYLNLSVVGIDQFNNPTFLIAWLKTLTRDVNQDAIINSTNTANTSVTLDPALFQILPNSDTITTAPLITRLTIDPNTTVPLVLSAPYNVQDPSVDPGSIVNLRIKSCKPGYQLSDNAHSTGYVCACVNDTKILNCAENEGIILLQDGYWAGTAPSSISQSQLVFLQCPAMYCNCRYPTQRPEWCTNVFYETDTENNMQCHGTRKGLLCGECITGLSVGILRSNCRNCTQDTTKFSLAILGFADVSLTLAILFVSVKYQAAFPASLKGLLFYVQTIYWSTEFAPASCWNMRQYLLYINSALSLYFPWDFCFRPGAKALEMAAIKFFTPVVVAITTIFVFLLFKRSRERMWNGIVTLILLLYPSLVHNCASLLHCNYIAEGNSYEQRWYTDSSVQCYGDWLHIVLGVTSIVLLVVLGAIIPLTLLLVLYTSVKISKNQDDSRFYSISAALSEGYKVATLWWCSIDLFRRYVLLILLVFFPGRTVISALLVMAMTAAYGVIQPYTVLWHNFVEIAILGYYVVILLFNSASELLKILTTHIYASTPDVLGLQLPTEDRLTWVYATLIYAPLALTCFLLLRTIYGSRRLCGRNRKAEARDICEDESSWHNV